MTKIERETILKSRTSGSQEFLCKPCFVQETGNHWEQAVLTGTCYKCNSGPTRVIPRRSDTTHFPV